MFKINHGVNMRIQIIGHSGSGKSTLAKEIANEFSLPILYLDTVKYYGDFKERSKDEQVQIVSSFLNEHQDWVIDGSYLSLCKERFSLCDVIIYLNYNRFYCYRMCKKRIKSGKRRESFPCPDRLDKEFKQWILFKGRTRKRKKQLMDTFNHANGKHYYFKNRRKLEKSREELFHFIKGLTRYEKE